MSSCVDIELSSAPETGLLTFQAQDEALFEKKGAVTINLPERTDLLTKEIRDPEESTIARLKANLNRSFFATSPQPLRANGAENGHSILVSAMPVSESKKAVVSPEENILNQSVARAEQSIRSSFIELETALEERKQALLLQVVKEKNAALSKLRNDNEQSLLAGAEGKEKQRGRAVVVELEEGLAATLHALSTVGEVRTDWVDVSRLSADVHVNVRISTQFASRQLSMAHTNGQLVATGQQSGNVFLWDPTTGRQVAASKTHNDAVWAVASGTGNGQKSKGCVVVSASRDRVLTLWDVQANTHVECRGHKNEVISACVLTCPSGPTYAVSSSFDHTVRLWDTRTGECVRTVNVDNAIAHNLIQVDEEGKLVAAACNDGTVRVWNTTTGEQVSALSGHTGRVWTVCSVDPSRKWIASGGADNAVRVWDAGSGHLLQTMRGHSDWVLSLCGIRNEHTNEVYVVSGSQDRTVRVWRARDNVQDLTPSSSNSSSSSSFPPNPVQCVRVMRGHSAAVLAVCVVETEAGKMVASGSRDGTSRLWNPLDGRCLSSFQTDGSAVQAMCVAPWPVLAEERAHEEGQFV
eukprot:comp16357_c0_seq1/m.14191 comp16357_c0_seq1/g.14191  ORF comp16357_c0_seq1/g.14191 comp16357_c0_seq1/m.14191 type:complete len:580 (-) comp16357_c0_seq1:101-1840(-)